MARLVTWVFSIEGECFRELAHFNLVTMDSNEAGNNGSLLLMGYSNAIKYVDKIDLHIHIHTNIFS